MKLEFKTTDDDDGYTIGCADWSFIPRIGDIVHADGLVSKSDWGNSYNGQTEYPQHQCAFKVEAVIYEVDFNGKFEAEGDPHIVVWCVPHEPEIWEGART